jgi:glycosyltransferase involved in cell wall biosynthesis
MTLTILYIDTERVWRGGQEQLFGLMLGMMKRGHQVTLAAPPGCPLSSKAIRSGIATINFQQRAEMSVLALSKFFAAIRTQRPDILHFNTPRAILSGGLAARLSSVPATVVSRRVNFPLRSSLSTFKYNYLVDRILTVSYSIRSTLLRAGVRANKVQVVYEGVDLDWVDAQSEAEKLTPDTAGPFVVTVAHLSPEKGHATLLRAISLLKDRFPGTRYYIMGEGNLRNELEGQASRLSIADHVVFTGFRADCEALMSQFDLFCLPSLSEGLSSAILAAMANRLPVVATDVGGIPELVKDGETGRVVVPNCERELAKALESLLESPSLRRRMGEAGRRRIEQEFTVERKLDETERAYLKLLGSRNIR